MKLARCILAFEKAISESHRPEDRALGVQYLAALAPLLAKVSLSQSSKSGVEDIDRLFSQTWIVDTVAFAPAFELWSEAKKEIRNEK